ncbi:hypothetical protein GCM10010124_25910 [Pilimelia terevasa]|uniref:Phage FDXHR zinc binding domain-containing protein n=1 Tax=Pilimelia terevasa TaxID=53372 RepID=A0A8J3BMC4_9ACTN|nr:hypothetical protein [Pilimelia terevasa]GGK31956.1 hypothetical protein GCM10010124_25910 [Pilimelia terevasa]
MTATLTAATCPTCRARFADVDLFDAHRQRGACHDPAAAGLIRIDGIWTEWLLLIGADA